METHPAESPTELRFARPLGGALTALFVGVVLVSMAFCPLLYVLGVPRVLFDLALTTPAPVGAIITTVGGIIICPALLTPGLFLAFFRRRYGQCTLGSECLEFRVPGVGHVLSVPRDRVSGYRPVRHGVLVEVAGRGILAKLLCPLVVLVTDERERVAVLSYLSDTPPAAPQRPPVVIHTLIICALFFPIGIHSGVVPYFRDLFTGTGVPISELAESLLSLPTLVVCYVLMFLSLVLWGTWSQRRYLHASGLVCLAYVAVVVAALVVPLGE